MISNRGFFKINASHPNSPLLLTLSLTQTSLTLSLTLSLSHKTSERLSHSPFPLSLTLFSHSVSTISHLSSHSSQRGVQSFDKVSTITHKALSSFSLHHLSKLKKKRWVALCKVCFTVWLPRNSGKNQRNFGFNSFFFLFWFLYWISNRTVKKDRNFIVFWDWICLWVWFFFFFFFMVLFCALFCSWVDIR